MIYSSDFQFYVATIYGEAGNSNEAVWKTIAHSMNNRIGLGEWASQKDLMDIVRNTRYDANQGNRTTKPLKSKNRLNCEQKGEPSCSPIRLTI